VTDATVHKLSSTDAFVVTDLPGAARADGIVRCAKKVLIGSTRSLARARTYAWALLGQQVSGASAAVNAVGDGRGKALGAFCTELAPKVADGSLSLAPGKGVGPGDLAGLGSVVEPDHAAFVAGVLACAAAGDGLGGRRVAVEFDGGAGDDLTAALAAAGADVVAHGPEALGAEADVLLFGSTAGVLDHHRAAASPATLFLPTGDLAFTPRALAVASRAGATVLPDFLTTAGPLAARVGLDPAEALGERAAAAVAHEEGPVLGACRAAEEFLSGWVDELPFGRPIG
jgi:hypothetical protein